MREETAEGWLFPSSPALPGTDTGGRWLRASQEEGSHLNLSAQISGFWTPARKEETSAAEAPACAAVGTASADGHAGGASRPSPQPRWGWGTRLRPRPISVDLATATARVGTGPKPVQSG